MKLSIVIPLYNKEEYIDRCLKSLLAHELLPNEYEIIIVDDGSKDSGAQIASTYARRHENIQFFSQENSGPSVARNKGLDASKGDYIYFLDADDFLAPNVLNSLLKIAEQNKLEILEFDTKEVKDGSVPDSLSHNLEDLDIHVMDGISYIAEFGFRNEAWRYIIHKNLLSDTGIRFIEGTLYEDVIFTASLFLKAKRIAKVDLDVHRYVTVENSIVRSKDAAHNLKFIHGMTYAVEKIHEMIKNLNPSHVNHHRVVKKLKARQQAFVLALIIRTFKHRLLNNQDLNKVLTKMNELGAYPIDPKIGGLENSGFIYNSIFIPISNNKFILFLSMRLRWLVPVR